MRKVVRKVVWVLWWEFHIWASVKLYFFLYKKDGGTPRFAANYLSWVGYHCA